jgi:hypothetical protein
LAQRARFFDESVEVAVGLFGEIVPPIQHVVYGLVDIDSVRRAKCIDGIEGFPHGLIALDGVDGFSW